MSDEYLMPESDRDKLWDRILDLTDGNRDPRRVAFFAHIYMDVNAMINAATMRAYEAGKAAARGGTAE